MLIETPIRPLGYVDCRALTGRVLGVEDGPTTRIHFIFDYAPGSPRGAAPGSPAPAASH